MSFCYSTRTIQCPVRAVGNNVENRLGVTVATAPDSFIASALADLINAGHPAVKRAEDEHDIGEARTAAMFLRARRA